MKNWIVRQKWYHQRFDGCPHFLSLIGMAETKKESRKPAGSEASIRICFFYDHKADWYILEEDNRKTTEIFLEKAGSNENFAKKLMSRWKEDEEAFYSLCHEIENMDLTSLDNREIISLCNRFYTTYANKVSSSSIIDGFALGSDKIVAEKIHAHLKSIGRDDEHYSLFPVLTAPVHLSFTNEAELELLRIALEMEKDPALLESPERLSKLVNHQKRFFWLNNNYIDANVLSLEHFASEMKKLLEKDVKHELDFISTHPQKNREEKEHLIEELKLPPEIVSLLHYSEDFTHWQDQRKKSTFFTTHYLTLILEEVAKRTGFTASELKYSIPGEIDRVFEGSITKGELQGRMAGCMVVMDSSGVKIYPGEKELYEKVKSLDVPEGLKVIKGLPASLGKAVGRARVVRTVKDIGKVEKGDILIAVMTRPDYVIGMKKAAAIVTDEGGLTCHAAIVARELRVPCVIATKIASRVIKDGDMIEVDANAGEVRIIS